MRHSFRQPQAVPWWAGRQAEASQASERQTGSHQLFDGLPLFGQDAPL